MPRIRTIKPEFWDSPSTAKASAVARLAFIGMWNWADDFGRGTANLKELEGFIFPNDDVNELSSGTSENFRHVVAEVSDCFGVVFYKVDGRPYYAIPSWESHQRNEKRAKSKFPGPEDADPHDSNDFHGSSGKSRNFRHTVTEAPRSSGTGTGEQGNRGTGEENTCSTAPPSSDHTPATTPARFDEFWDAYPRKVGKQKARTKYAAAVKRSDEQTVIDGARRLATDPNLPEKQFIPHPTTWLERNGWEDEPLPAPTSGPISLDQRRAEAVHRITNHQAWTPPPNTTPDLWGQREGVKQIGR